MLSNFLLFYCRSKEDYEMRKKNLLIINLEEKAAKEFRGGKRQVKLILLKSPNHL
jgi:hypothetical protein